MLQRLINHSELYFVSWLIIIYCLNHSNFSLKRWQTRTVLTIPPCSIQLSAFQFIDVAYSYSNFLFVDAYLTEPFEETCLIVQLSILIIWVRSLRTCNWFAVCKQCQILFWNGIYAIDSHVLLWIHFMRIFRYISIGLTQKSVLGISNAFCLYWTITESFAYNIRIRYYKEIVPEVVIVISLLRMHTAFFKN